MAHGRTFEGFDPSGNVHRVVVEQSEYGYQAFVASRIGWSSTFGERVYIGERSSSALAREAAQEWLDTRNITPTEDWYTK